MRLNLACMDWVSNVTSLYEKLHTLCLIYRMKMCVVQQQVREWFKTCEERREEHQ